MKKAYVSFIISSSATTSCKQKVLNKISDRKHMTTTNSSLSNLEILLDANPNYLPQASGAKVLVKNIAENILYRKEPLASKNATTFSFKTTIDNYFMDRGIMCNVENIPLTMKIMDATGLSTTATPTNDDFHTTLFQDYKYLTLKHLGFHNCIDKVDVLIDGERISTSNVSEILTIVSNAYDEEDVNKYFDASQPDYVYDDALLNDTISYVPSYTTKGLACKVKKPVSALDINSPYSAVTNPKNNSRTPLFTDYNIEPADAKANSLTATHSFNLSNLSFWIPFNILSVNSESQVPIYNGASLQITVSLHTNWVSRLFNCIPIVDAAHGRKARYQFALDTAKFNGGSVGEVNQYVKLYRAPQAIQSQIDPNRSWILEYPKVSMDMETKDITFGANEREKEVTSTLYSLTAIPNKIFLAVVPRAIQDTEHILNNDHYCRWDNLKVELTGTKTDICSGYDSELLYQLSKKNGLNMNKQTALHTKGFPVILDVSDDLGCLTNTYVGINVAGSSGKYTLQFQGRLTRLHCDGVATHAKLQKQYVMKVILSHTAFFAYKMMGRKFCTIESLSSEELQTLNSRVNDLYANLVPRVNVIGGAGLWAMLGDKFKGVANGVKNVLSAVISNKDGFRDNLKKAYSGSGNNIIGGADSHSPLGGRSLDNWGLI